MVVALPNGLVGSRAHLSNPLRHSRLERTDDHTNRSTDRAARVGGTGRSYGRRMRRPCLSDSHDAVEMIGHGHPSIQSDIRKMFGNRQPTRLNDVPTFCQRDLSVALDGTEQALHVASTDRDEVSPGRCVVELRQSCSPSLSDRASLVDPASRREVHEQRQVLLLADSRGVRARHASPLRTSLWCTAVAIA